MAHCRLTVLGALVAVLFIASSAAHAAQPGLVAAYGFEEGNGTLVSDASGNSNTGTISGATWTTAGKFGKALTFNGTSNMVTVADSNLLDLTTGMTLSAWVFPTAHGNGVWRNVLIKERSGGEVYNLYSNVDTNRPAVYVARSAAPGTPLDARGTAQLPLNTWTHLAATHDGTTLRLYVNGGQVGSRAVAGSLLTSTGALRIGGNSLWGEFFQGMIDEVRVYNRALSQTEIQTDMVTPVGSAAPPPPPPTAAEIGAWAGPFDWPLIAVHAALLPTGQVLAWDGQEFGASSAQLWDPTTHAFTPVPNDPNLFCAGHVLLPDGRLLAVGGHISGFVGLPDATVFDPATNTWTSKSPMAVGRWYPTATTLPDGRVLVVSGTTTCQTCIADVPEIYNPVTNVWTRLPNARLPIPLYPYNFVLPDGRVLTAGSQDGGPYTHVLNLSTQSWTVVDATPPPDGGSAAMYRPGKILRSGSSWAAEGGPADTATYVLDMTQPAPGWRQTPPMAFGRAWHTLTLLPDGNVLATGGGQVVDPYNVGAATFAAEMWSPATEAWTTMASMVTPRLYHSIGLLLPDGRVLVAGSGRLGVDQFSAEIYSPPYLFKGARPTITSSPSILQYGSSFTVETPDAATISSAALIRLGSVTHTFNEDQRFLPLTFQASAGALNIQAPANANLAPPGYYMLFIVTSQGVPSVASMVRLPLASADTTPPTPPTGLVATGGVGSVSLVWTAATDNVGVTGYQVHRSTTSGFVPTVANRIAQPSVTNYTDSGLAAGTYYYRVTATDAAGNLSGPSGEAQATATAGTAGLVAAYSFNEGSGATVADASGNGHTGTISGATWTTAGKFGKALTFNGTSNMVTVADSNLLDLTTGMTLSAWVFPTAHGNGVWRNVLIKERSGGEVYNLYSNVDTNRPAVYVARSAAPGTPLDARGTAQLPLNTWTHLAATHDGTTLRLYVNGGQVGSRAVAGSLLTSTGALRIGGNSLWGEFFQGMIDEVRVYNRALTGSEIQADMAAPLQP